MPEGMPRKLVVVAILAAAVVVHHVLDSRDALYGILPASALSAAMSALGLSTFVGRSPKHAKWLPAAILSCTMVLTGIIAFLNLTHPAPAVAVAYHGWVVLPGMGLVVAAMTKRLLCLMDDVRGWEAAAERGTGPLGPFASH